MKITGLQWRYLPAFLMIAVISHAQDYTKTRKDTLLQNKIGGVYATDMTSFWSGSVMAYARSLTFKPGMDSFYYWQSGNTSGKGTYKINNDNTLTLTFENTKQNSKPAVTSYQLIKENVPAADDASKRRVSFRFYDAKNNPAAASIRIISKSGKDLVKAGTLEIRQFDIDTADFPIRVKAVLVESFPIFFTVNEASNFHSDLYFQPNTGITYCNGEEWRYEILQLRHDVLVLRKIEDDYFTDENRRPKWYTFVSYMRM
jgi:hypothetical protein